MSTLIIGKRCIDGVILAADRRELRGFEPNEQSKICQINCEVNSTKAMVLLAGAGVAAFWDEVAWSSEQCLIKEAEPKAKSFLDIVSGVSSISISPYESIVQTLAKRSASQAS